MSHQEQAHFPPHDIDAEEHLIGSCLIGGSNTFTEVNVLIKAVDFWSERNSLCWESMEALTERNEPINQLTVAHELMSRNKSEQVGGAAYLSHLISICATHLDAESYANIIRKLSTERMLISVGEQIVALGYEESSNPEAHIVRAEQYLFKLHERRCKSQLLNPRDISEAALKRYTELRDLGDSTAIPYGFAKLDIETGGAHRGDYIIVGGRPRIGKSSLLQSFTKRMSQKYSVLLVSAEMSTEQVLDRETSAGTGLPVARIAHGHYDDPTTAKIFDSIGQISERKMYLLPRSGRMGTADIAAAVRRLKHEKGLDVVMVDYIGILADEFGHNANERITQISRKLKGIASEYDVALIAASQLSRDVEKARANKRPVLADLRDSGSLEQDADVVMLLYRDELYYTENEWLAQFDRHVTPEPYPKGRAEVILAKQRQREANITVWLAWQGQTMEYLDYENT